MLQDLELQELTLNHEKKKQLKDISEEHEILKKVVNPTLQLAHHLKDTLCLYILSSPRATSEI